MESASSSASENVGGWTPPRASVRISADQAAGLLHAQKLLRVFQVELGRRGIARNIDLSVSPWRGFGAATVVIDPPGVVYCRISADDIPEIVEETVLHQRTIGRLLFEESPDISALPPMNDLPLFGKQLRIAMRNCGLIDPENLDQYIARDGYAGLEKVLSGMSSDDVIREMKQSGLRGRGGAGFPTGSKWEFCRKAPGSPKYVVCNADEGDPGAFMDRSILESDPHTVLEGMIIAGYAIGAQQGYIYCREEYPLAIERLELAIQQAQARGLLGENILGSGFSFDIEMKQGAGAFVCGEETALIASIEGRRGEPRPRPPFPAMSGLWGKPTNINNVKSYAMAPVVILKGAAWFSSIGTPKSTGTAIFALTGKINNTGLVEVPMGISLGDIIFDIGGGIPGGKKFKAVQTGGPLGGCLPATSLNTPVDFDSLNEAGAVMGSGGMIVVDDDTCMVELARYFLTFATAESCGKCVPCRAGGVRLLESLERITEGHGSMADLQTIREVSQHMMSSSLCGLGQRTPGPVLAALRFFEQEFLDHINDKTCRAGQCRPLVRAKCINTCPAGVDTPAYLAMVAQGRYADALAVHRQRNPFPLICGRACPAFCETKCRRGDIDQPVAVRLVKRFMADHEYSRAWVPEKLGTREEREAASKKKIAIIGAGPGGLTAALRLAQRGYRVTVFEKMAVPGGMLTWAIPAYRLPRDVVLAEIEAIKRAGVEIRCNTEMGRDFTLDDLLQRDGFDGVILAIGASKSRRLGVPGERKTGVVDGMDFLRAAAVDAVMLKAGAAAPEDLPDVRGKSVGVVGGGDVAIDVARTALRMGARMVHVIYRRAGDDMPAAHLPEEIEGARQEGIHFHILANPVEVLGYEQVTGVRLQQQRLAEFDDSARRKPVPQGGESYVLDLDILVPAIGQTPDLSAVQHVKIDTTRSGTFVVNDALATSVPKVFAIGDAVTGPSTIVEAVNQGNLVAASVDHWLKTGQYDHAHYDTPRHDVNQVGPIGGPAGTRRAAPAKTPVAQRQNNFQAVEQGLDEVTARAEARRCLRCDLEWLELMKLPRPKVEV